MVQHKCGTCQHFEESGIPGSGWCRHPLRHDIQHVVLVRKSELACRDGWAGDLWEGRSGSAAVISKNGAGNPVAAPVAKARDEHQFTDRVTTVAVHAGPAQNGNGIPADGTSGTVEIAKIVAPEPAEDLELGAQVVRRAEAAPEPMVPREVTRSIPAPREDTISANRVSQSPVRQSPLKQEPFGTSQPVVRQVTTRIPEPGVRFPMERRPAEDRPVVAPVQRTAMTSVPRPDETRAESEPRQYGWTEPLPQLDTFRGTTGRTETVAVPVEPPPVVLPSGTSPERPVHEPPQPPRPARPIAERLAALPRCCQTCRDFRPIEGGERGWCNNPYAFSKRTQVDARELSCETSIGSWWMAADDWWLDQGDISHHGRPTPNVDDLLLQLLKGKSRRSPDSRRA